MNIENQQLLLFTKDSLINLWLVKIDNFRKEYVWYIHKREKIKGKGSIFSLPYYVINVHLYYIISIGISIPWFCLNIKTKYFLKRIFWSGARIIVNKRIISLKIYLYTRKLYCEHFTPAFWLQNNLCKNTTQEHKYNRWFSIQNPDWNVRFKDFWYRKINMSQNIY